MYHRRSTKFLKNIHSQVELYDDMVPYNVLKPDIYKHVQ